MWISVIERRGHREKGLGGSWDSLLDLTCLKLSVHVSFRKKWRERSFTFSLLTSKYYFTLCFPFLRFTYLFARDRDSMSKGEGQRERDQQTPC